MCFEGILTWRSRLLTGLVASSIWSGALMTQAQNGDRSGENQPPPNPDWVIPPAPVLSPEKALETFTLPEGFHIELVASEPLVHDPVEIEFDGEGRMWVVEMRGYMPNPEGEGEDQPVGRVVVLEDLDGDGMMDASTVFADGLVMPRALGLVAQGVLVAEPPHLWYFKDLNSDLVADQKILVADDYGGTENPEHTANALRWGMDNWIYSANHTTRFKFVDGSFIREPTVFRGQWGLSMDDYGRPIFNSNSDQLRGDLLPGELMTRNPSISRPAGVNHRIATDQRVWPSRITPGVNRGYQRGVLNEHGVLTRFTAACGPVIYRGNLMPEEFIGNAFVAEPSGNLIKRNIIEETDGVLSAKQAYTGLEFLTSTDERFRPVNLNNGPDGALYIVDFYRGIIQHRIYMTTFLRRQVEDRELDVPTGLGRIYRVYHKDYLPSRKGPGLASMTSSALVNQLNHQNGWRRDTAQRLLVEKQQKEIVPRLKEMAINSDSHLGRLHALWTLDGLNQIDIPTLDRAMLDRHPKVKAAALQIAGPLISESGLAEKLKMLTGDEDPYVRWHAYLQLNTLGDEAHEIAVERLIKEHEQAIARDALLSGFAGEEIELLEVLLKDLDSRPPSEGINQLAKLLSKNVFQTRTGDQVEALIQLITRMGALDQGLQASAIEGILSLKPRPQRNQPAPKVKPVILSSEPELLNQLLGADSPEIKELGSKLAEFISWPNKFVQNAAPEVAALTKEEESLKELGALLYTASCAACHQPHGNGQDGLAPPLVDSEWVLGSEKRLARVVLHGLTGPIIVKGEEYSLAMPGLSVFNDEQIAAILTYVRREWGHEASPVSPETVGEVRQEDPDRFDMWTAEELFKLEENR